MSAAAGNAGRRRGVPIAVCGVNKVYRSGSGTPVIALHDLTLDVPAGQALAVTGPSGSGKSTLLHLIGAMDLPDSGRITVADQELTKMKERERAVARRSIGFVFQRFHLLPALTVIDNVIAPVLPYRVDYDKTERATQLLAAVGLGDRANDLPSKLSGGQQQRVAVARALITQPGLLLADEPTGNLDTRTGTEVIDLLLRLRDEHGLTLIIATHDSAVAARTDRVLRLVDGQVHDDMPIAAELDPQDVLRQLRQLGT